MDNKITMEESGYCVLIKHCFLMGKNVTEAKEWLDKCYPETAPSSATVEEWYAKFKTGDMSTSNTGGKHGNSKKL